LDEDSALFRCRTQPSSVSPRLRNRRISASSSELLDRILAHLRSPASASRRQAAPSSINGPAPCPPSHIRTVRPVSCPYVEFPPFLPLFCGHFLMLNLLSKVHGFVFSGFLFFIGERRRIMGRLSTTLVYRLSFTSLAHTGLPDPTRLPRELIFGKRLVR